MNYTKITVLVLAALTVVGCASRPQNKVQVVQKERLTDAYRPTNTTVTIDFSKMLDVGVDYSRDVLPSSSVKPMMKRVMLSPNLVFEASRSSTSEPSATTGPTGDTGNAIGAVVSTELSSLLMSYMQNQGSELIAPAITRELADRWCNWYEGKESCSNVTWIERLLMMADSKDKAVLKLRPTAGLAVRALETRENTIDMVVLKDGDNVYVTPRKYKDQESLCRGFSLTVPAVYLSTELLDSKNGRIIARFDHSKGAQIKGNLSYSVAATKWVPVMQTGYTKYNKYGSREVPVSSSKYSYVESWEEESVLCSSIKEAYSEVRSATASSMNISNIANNLFRATIATLYR